MTLGLVLLAQTVAASPFFQLDPVTEGPGLVKEFGILNSNSEWSSPYGAAEIKYSGAYLQVGYEFFPRWLGYGRIGVASFSTDDNLAFFSESGGGGEVSADAAPFFGVGVKGQIPLGRNVSLHPYLEANRFSDYTSSNDVIISAVIFPPVVDEVPAQETLTIEKQYDLSAGLLLSYTHQGFVLYGGPTVYRRTASVQGELEIAGDTYKRESYTYRETGTVGGVAGVVIPLGETTDIFLELQQRSMSSLSGGLVYVRLNF